LSTVFLSAARDAGAQSVDRSLDEFLAAQGTLCIDDGEGGCLLMFAPLPAMIGAQDDTRNRCALIDYAGIADLLQTCFDFTDSTGGLVKKCVNELRRRPSLRS
jgi:hypothetical protein